jgi:hypothetical protein
MAPESAVRSVPGIALLAAAILAATFAAKPRPIRAAAPQETQAKVVIDHNSNDEATKGFSFPNVASPAAGTLGGNIAPRATLTLVDGEADPNGAALAALTDGLLPDDEDEPEANFFFDAGTPGGRFRMDFGSPVEIAEVRSYSWHPNTRGPQLYRLYGATGSSPNFCAAPKASVDPVNCGWRLIATVDTQPANGEIGGQYGVSITSPTGSLGSFRYLLFSCYATEADDAFGNTFYSEINVIQKK